MAARANTLDDFLAEIATLLEVQSMRHLSFLRKGRVRYVVTETGHKVLNSGDFRVFRGGCGSTCGAQAGDHGNFAFGWSVDAQGGLASGANTGCRDGVLSGVGEGRRGNGKARFGSDLSGPGTFETQAIG